MMTSSNFKNVPPPKEGAKGSVYSRFIPREELSSFSSWSPETLSGSTMRTGTGAPAEDPVPAAEVLAQQLTAARQGGYQDGYRDGMAALEGFKQGFATQITAQLGRLVESHGAQLDGLQQQLAQAVTQCALTLAREVVRSELALRPEAVVAVAQEAIDTLLLTARHVTVRVHPDDQPLAHGFAVLGLLGKTFGRADIHTDAAINAGEGVVNPPAGLFVHLDALRGALERAAAAENTALDVVYELAAGLVEGLPHFVGIAPGGFLDHQVAHDVGRHFEHGRMPPQSALGAADARVDGQRHHRHIGQVQARQHDQQGREVGEGGGADAHAVEIFFTLAL